MSYVIWTMKTGIQKNRYSRILDKHIMNQVHMSDTPETSTPACCSLHRACGYVVADDLFAGDPHSVYPGEKAPGSSRRARAGRPGSQERMAIGKGGCKIHHPFGRS